MADRDDREDARAPDARVAAAMEQVQPAPRVAPAPVPVGTPEPEIAAIVAVIAGLADGNCATKADVKLVRGHAETRAVRLNMNVAIGWGSTNRTLSGNRAISGSRACASFDDVQAYFGEVCGAACQDPAASRQVADQIGLTPVESFASIKDIYQIRNLPYTAHFVEQCRSCTGHGETSCPMLACHDGLIRCGACSNTGKATCSRCHGTCTVQVNGGSHTCNQCHGAGRYGVCHSCQGTGHVRCPICSGTGRVSCKPCETTGCFTRVYNSHLQGSVSRSIGFDEDAPQGFRLSCQAVAPLTTLAQTTGTLVRPEISSADGRAQLVLHCQTRHVHAEMDCKEIQVVIDALGAQHTIPLMPPFLDKVMASLISDIRSKATLHPVQALSQAATARVTRDILASVGRGGDAKAILAASPWGGAVSESCITEIYGWLKAAYSRAARSSVRRTWLWLSPLIVAGAVLANVLWLPLWILHRLENVTGVPSPSAGTLALFACEVTTIMPLVVCTWLLAGRNGRGRLRAGVGVLAQQSARQGLWPAFGLLLATGAGWGSATSQLNVVATELPRLPGAYGGSFLDQTPSTRSTGGSSASVQPHASATIPPPLSMSEQHNRPKHRF